MDLDARVTPAEIIAAMPDLTRQTIAMWVARGKLTERGRRGRAPLYRWGDVLQVERSTRRNPKSSRHRGRRENQRQPTMLAA